MVTHGYTNKSYYTNYTRKIEFLYMRKWRVSGEIFEWASLIPARTVAERNYNASDFSNSRHFDIFANWLALNNTWVNWVC